MDLLSCSEERRLLKKNETVNGGQRGKMKLKKWGGEDTIRDGKERSRVEISKSKGTNMANAVLV